MPDSSFLALWESRGLTPDVRAGLVPAQGGATTRVARTPRNPEDPENLGFTLCGRCHHRATTSTVRACPEHSRRETGSSKEFSFQLILKRGHAELSSFALASFVKSHQQVGEGRDLRVQITVGFHRSVNFLATRFAGGPVGEAPTEKQKKQKKQKTEFQ